MFPDSITQASKFINELIKIANFAQNGSHGALLRFSDERLSNEDMLEVEFSDQLDLNSYAEAINRTIEKGPGPGGTNIINALDVSLDRIFQTSSGMREDVIQVAVLITDGDDGKCGKEYTERKELFKNRNIKILAVGVGETDDENLKELVQSSEHFFKADKFEDLIGNVTEVIGALICEGIIVRSY